MMKSKPLISICCTTYNHELYIRQALDGFLMQRTNFPIEIIIHDDASTDRTAEIVREYAHKYPEIVKAIYQSENQYSKNIKPLIEYVYPVCQGKYIAMCEGDDYWTDPYKLQKQVDFMEKHPEYAICFHDVRLQREKVSDKYGDAELFSKAPGKPFRNTDATFTIKDTSKGGLIATCSALVRKNSTVRNLPEWFGESLTGDWLLWLLACSDKKIKYLNTVMAVYRLHVGGVSMQIKRDGSKLYVDRARMLLKVDGHFNGALHKELAPALHTYLQLLRKKNHPMLGLYTRYMLAQPWHCSCFLWEQVIGSAVVNVYNRWLSTQRRFLYYLREKRKAYRLTLLMRPIIARLKKENLDCVAIYGGGKHTHKLLTVLRGAPKVCCIIDDSRDGEIISGIDVISPAKSSEYCFKAVIISSDTFENILYNTAQAWHLPKIPIFQIYNKY